MDLNPIRAATAGFSLATGLRHTWASWHVQRGTSIQELKELGGWSSIEMVLRYAHLGGEHLKTAVSRIEGTNLAHANQKGRLRLVVSR